MTERKSKPGSLNRLNDWIAEYCRREQRGPEEVNILYRVMREGEFVRGQPGCRILAGIAPSHIVVMRKAMRELPDNNRNALWMKFSYPIDPLGRLYTNAQLAEFLNCNLKTFKNRIHSGKKQLANILSRMAA